MTMMTDEMPQEQILITKNPSKGGEATRGDFRLSLVLFEH